MVNSILILATFQNLNHKKVGKIMASVSILTAIVNLILSRVLCKEFKTQPICLFRAVYVAKFGLDLPEEKCVRCLVIIVEPIIVTIFLFEILRFAVVLGRELRRNNRIAAASQPFQTVSFQMENGNFEESVASQIGNPGSILSNPDINLTSQQTISSGDCTTDLREVNNQVNPDEVVEICVQPGTMYPDEDWDQSSSSDDGVFDSIQTKFSPDFNTLQQAYAPDFLENMVQIRSTGRIELWEDFGRPILLESIEPDNSGNSLQITHQKPNTSGNSLQVTHQETDTSGNSLQITHQEPDTSGNSSQITQQEPDTTHQEPETSGNSLQITHQEPDTSGNSLQITQHERAPASIENSPSVEKYRILNILLTTSKKFLLRSATFSLFLIIMALLSVLYLYLHKTNHTSEKLFVEIVTITKRGYIFVLPLFLVTSEQNIIDFVKSKIHSLARRLEAM